MENTRLRPKTGLKTTGTGIRMFFLKSTSPPWNHKWSVETRSVCFSWFSLQQLDILSSAELYSDHTLMFNKLHHSPAVFRCLVGWVLCRQSSNCSVVSSPNISGCEWIPNVFEQPSCRFSQNLVNLLPIDDECVNKQQMCSIISIFLSTILCYYTVYTFICIPVLYSCCETLTFVLWGSWRWSRICGILKRVNSLFHCCCFLLSWV